MTVPTNEPPVPSPATIRPMERRVPGKPKLTFLGLRHGVQQPAIEVLTEQLGVPGWLLWETARYVGRVEALPLEPGATLAATFPLREVAG